MRRLVFPVWLGGLVLTLNWLRALSTGGDPAFTTARAFALACAGYLVVATVVNIALALCHVRVRLPLVPLLVVASLSTPLAGMPAFASTPPPVMHRIAPTPTSSTSAPVPAPVLTRTPPPAPVVALTPAPATWRVEHGDCFWTIARRVAAARLGRAPSNHEVVAYWRPLIEANRARLAHPANPSLLFVGQELLLP